MIVCKDLCPIHKEQICCFLCGERETCPEACYVEKPTECPDRVERGGELTPAEEKVLPIMQTIRNLALQKKAIEAREKDMREKLKAAMEQFGVKSFDNDLVKVTYIAATTSRTVDTAALKKKYPAIAEECSKVSNKSAYIKIEVKDNG